MKPKPRASVIALLGTVAVLTVATIAILVIAITDRIHVSGTSASGIKHNGGHMIKRLEIGDVREITLIGKWEIELRQGRDRQLELSWPQTVGDLIHWKAEEDRIELEFDPPFWLDGPGVFATARITLTQLALLDLKGYNRVSLRGFNGDRLTLEMKGNNLVIGDSGDYTTLDLSVAGMNHVNLGTVRVRDANVHIQGNNNVTLAMDGGKLSGFIAGVGALDYYGTVSAETVRIAGMAHVGKLD